MRRSLLVSLFLSCPSLALAQRDSLRLKELSVEELLNVEVTSVSRRAEPLYRAASSIQVITQDDIRRSGFTSLPALLRLASNLQVAQIDSRNWAISARGFTSTTANKLLVLIDGRSVYTPLFSGVFWDVQDVPLPDVDRIEVISGPGATLWGANAVNGVINIITKQARDSRGLLVRGVGSTRGGTGIARIGGRLGARADYRVYAKGFARGAAYLSNGAQDSVGDWRMGRAGARVDLRMSDATMFTVQGDAYAGSADMSNTSDTKMSGGNILARWSRTRSERSSLQLQLYYDRTNREIPNQLVDHLDTWDADFQMRSGLGARHEIVWGLGARFTVNEVTNSAAFAFLPERASRNLLTGFIQDEFTIIPERLRVALGTKVEHNDYTGFELQPSGRLSWSVGPGVSLWTAVSRALRTPSRIDREFYVPGQPPYVIQGGPGFRSERQTAYELGFRHQARRMALTLSTWYAKYGAVRSVEQVNPPAPSPTRIGNGQHGESYGAELTADYQLSNRWKVHAGYTELRLHLRPNPGSTDTTRGSGESHDPERQLLMRTSLNLPGNVELEAGFRYVSAITNQQVPAYTALRVRVGWRPVESLELSLAGQNLLDDRHGEFGPPGRREFPRTFIAGFEWRP